METNLDVLETFSLFRPYSGGRDEDLTKVTISTINNVLPALAALFRKIGLEPKAIEEVSTFLHGDAQEPAAEWLKVHLDREGSDKANFHDYHILYGHILARPDTIKGIFEVGLGTNNTAVVSNMGAHGRPGASLRAFKAYCSNAAIFGADIDRQILFEEDRIKTFFLDQTDPASFTEIAAQLPDDLDLVIDDGLHAPDANLRTLAFGLGKVKQGGWVVVEDISPRLAPLWSCVSAAMPQRLETHLVNAKNGMLFAVRRLG